jgi:pimeloyl-ACP methyl ester carboxylesterase
MFLTARDGARLHVIEQGQEQGREEGREQGQGDTVLWLQGLNAPAAAWAVQLAHFAQTCRSLAPDGRGVGESDAPPPPYTTRAMAEDALDVLDAFKIEKAHVVGLSLGGAVAQELALSQPRRVRSLSLLSTFAFQPPRSRALLQGWRALYPEAVRTNDLRRAWELQAYSWLFTDRFWRGEANVRAALKFAAAQPAQSVNGFQGQCDAALSHDTRSRLNELRLPSLVIHGALDQLSPLASGHELGQLIPEAELVVLPDVGHAVNIEAQRAVNQALRGLWRRS